VPADMPYELPEPVPYAMSSTEYMAGDVPMVADAVFAASDIESIESELVATSVNIYENDGSEIVVKWMSDREIDEQKPQIIFDNGQLILKEKKELFSLDLSALFGRTQSYINIYIPAGSYEDLDLETASGNIKSSAAGLIFDELDLDTVSGYIDLSGVTVAGGAEISATSGSVNIYNSSADKFEITSISGDINVSVIDAGDISLKSTSGYIGLSQVNADDNLEINSVSGYITAKSVLAAEQGVHSTSGDITLSDIAFEKLGISTVSGNTNLSLPNVNTFTLKVSTVSGSIQNNSGKARESAEASIEFSSISGDLYIEN
jgi:DUF4097 and DUF4098 domain-containing protein YvlB